MTKLSMDCFRFRALRLLDSWPHPLALAAMPSTQTVSLTFQDWFLPADQAITLKPYADTQRPDPIKTLHHGFFAVGCALGALDFLRDAQQQAPMNVLEQLIEQYQAKVCQMSQLFFAGLTDTQLSITAATEKRAQAIYLCQQLSQIVITTAGGAGNLSSHSAQRLYREALMFSVSGQTAAYRQISLQQFQRMASLLPPAQLNAPETLKN